eukprot:GEZU01009405.1.p2 GENE.GEZU01009405.1~~GEZU01009405.1.p2  ORF type:complete len:107 (+),score=17.92 GEZU01009405.1:200-520(+)
MQACEVEDWSTSRLRITLVEIQLKDGRRCSPNLVIWEDAQRRLFSKYWDMRTVAQAEIAKVAYARVSQLLSHVEGTGDTDAVKEEIKMATATGDATRFGNPHPFTG